jgi:hypothetical protein
MPAPLDPRSEEQSRAWRRSDVERLHKSFRRFAKGCVIAAATVMIVLIAAFAGRRYYITHFPTSLTNENPLREACEILAAQAASSPDSRDRLKTVMLKLRDGWPGLRASNYYPFQFTPDMVLWHAYSNVAKNAAAADLEGRADLLKLLDETRPDLSKKDKWESFKRAFEIHGLKFDYAAP